MSDILVIPDSHCRANVGVRRFEWLAKLIKDRQPEKIVHLGDMFDMESLSSYDVGKKSYEGRRYQKDLKAGQSAFDAMGVAFSRSYNPDRHFLLGNHEHRIDRVLEEEPRLDGTLSTADLGVKERGWKAHPFLKTVDLNGVAFSHYFISGVMARPIGGEHPANSMIRKSFKSCVAGHLHLWDYSERTDVMGRRIQCVMAGCFLEPGQFEAYAGPANKLWRNAVTYLHHAHNGEFDVEMISIDRLRREYSK